MARLCFIIPYALCIEKKKYDEKKKKKKKIPPTYPNVFEHVTPNTYNFFLGLSE